MGAHNPPRWASQTPLLSFGFKPQKMALAERIKPTTSYFVEHCTNHSTTSADLIGYIFSLFFCFSFLFPFLHFPFSVSFLLPYLMFLFQIHEPFSNDELFHFSINFSGNRRTFFQVRWTYFKIDGCFLQIDELFSFFYGLFWKSLNIFLIWWFFFKLNEPFSKSMIFFN